MHSMRFLTHLQYWSILEYRSCYRYPLSLSPREFGSPFAHQCVIPFGYRKAESIQSFLTILVGDNRGRDGCWPMPAADAGAPQSWPRLF